MPRVERLLAEVCVRMEWVGGLGESGRVRVGEQIGDLVGRQMREDMRSRLASGSLDLHDRERPALREAVDERFENPGHRHMRWLDPRGLSEELGQKMGVRFLAEERCGR